MGTLSIAERRRFSSCPVDCKKLPNKICSLSDYFAAISGVVSTNETFWFRGHSRPDLSLTPGALRYSTIDDRRKALELMSDFKRIAESKLGRIPDQGDDFKWAQIAQHYGLPTRLLDWTESATTALYFACLEPTNDGMIYVLNPVELNKRSDIALSRILDPQHDRALILKFLHSGPKQPSKPRYPIAVNPAWSSERLIVQKGTFTLHGSLFSLDKARVSSLVAVLLLREWKAQLRAELGRVGVDEMTLFPELEHSCRHLKMRSGLLSFD